MGKKRKVDKEKIKVATKMLLEAIGEDPNDPRFDRTPERVAKFWDEFLNREPQINIKVFEENHSGLVIIKDIPFFSVCEHHLLPFFGTATIGYLPKGKVIGLSKIVRIVNKLASQPQLQERLTDQIAEYISKKLKPHGVIVVTKALHLCMAMRNLGCQHTTTIVSSLKGILLHDPTIRNEALSLLRT